MFYDHHGPEKNGRTTKRCGKQVAISFECMLWLDRHNGVDGQDILEEANFVFRIDAGRLRLQRVTYNILSEEGAGIGLKNVCFSSGTLLSKPVF